VVCWSVTVVRPAKTAEPIKMPFRLRTMVVPKNRVLDGGPDPSWAGAILRGNGRPIVKYRDTVVSCAKMAEPIEMLFGLSIRVGPRKHVLDMGPDRPKLRGSFYRKGNAVVCPTTLCLGKRVHSDATGQIPLNCPCVAAMDLVNTIEPSVCGSDAAFL